MMFWYFLASTSPVEDGAVGSAYQGSYFFSGNLVFLHKRLQPLDLLFVCQGWLLVRES